MKKNSHLCPSHKVRRSLWRNIWRFFCHSQATKPYRSRATRSNSMFGFSIIGEDEYAVEECAKLCVFSPPPPLFLFISSSVQSSPLPSPPPKHHCFVRSSQITETTTRTYIHTTNDHISIVKDHPRRPNPTQPDRHVQQKTPFLSYSQGFDKCFVSPKQASELKARNQLV
jgi:hypothetical protein